MENQGTTTNAVLLTVSVSKLTGHLQELAARLHALPAVPGYGPFQGLPYRAARHLHLQDDVFERKRRHDFAHRQVPCEQIRQNFY